MYIYIYIYIFIKSSFPRTRSLNFALMLETLFFMALIAFWKRALNCFSMQLYHRSCHLILQSLPYWIFYIYLNQSIYLPKRSIPLYLEWAIWLPPGYIGTDLHRTIRWLLELYVLATSKVISGCVRTYDSVNSWLLYSASPLRNQAAYMMTQYPTQSHYPNTELTSPYSILLMPSSRVGCENDNFL